MEKENKDLSDLVRRLLSCKKPIWKKIGYEISKPRRKKVEVNISKLEKYAHPGSTIVVPGKVLGSGALTKNITVGAFAFSGNAEKLILKAGGKSITIDELVKSNPDGKGVMIIK